MSDANHHEEYSRTNLAARKANFGWPGFLSARHLAEYLSISESTLRRLLEDGHLPKPDFTPSPRIARWSRQRIDEHLLARQEVISAGPTIDDILEASTHRRAA